MINHWLKRIETSVFHDKNVSVDQIGYNLNQIIDETYLEDFKVLFISSTMPINYHFRMELNKLANHFSFKFADIGHIRSSDMASIGHLLKDLTPNHKIVILGGDDFDANAILKATKDTTFKQQTTLISNRCQKLDSELTNNIGWQRHFTEKKDLLGIHSGNSIGLGNLKQNLISAEPLIRDSQHAILDCKALDQSCFGEGSLTGLNIYEAAQLMKFIGLSDQIKTVHFKSNGKQPLKLGKIYALLCWYYLEGLEYKTSEDAFSNKNKTYVVSVHGFDQEIIFIQGSKTGNWWVKNPINPDSMIACSYEDYQSVCNNNIPDKIMHLFE